VQAVRRSPNIITHGPKIVIFQNEIMLVSDHCQLVVWQRSITLALEAYSISRRFPRQETYGLASQIRRAAVSIAANIADGNGRTHRREYAHHLSIARGSLREVETLLEIDLGLGYTSEEELTTIRELLDHVGRMLTRLLKRMAS